MASGSFSRPSGSPAWSGAAPPPPGGPPKIGPSEGISQNPYPPPGGSPGGFCCAGKQRCISINPSQRRSFSLFFAHCFCKSWPSFLLKGTLIKKMLLGSRFSQTNSVRCVKFSQTTSARFPPHRYTLGRDSKTCARSIHHIHFCRRILYTNQPTLQLA